MIETRRQFDEYMARFVKAWNYMNDPLRTEAEFKKWEPLFMEIAVGLSQYINKHKLTDEDLKILNELS